MIFDDHEVTDDWNLNEDWVRTVNDSEMGAAVLRNALAAYAVFQDWGNQPEDYIDGKGKQILDALTVTIDGDSVTPPAAVASKDNQEEEVGHTLFDVLGLGPTVAGAFGSSAAQAIHETVDAVGETIDGVLMHDPEEDIFHLAPEPLKQWDWAYDPYPDDPFFKIICLDTRTRRGYPTKRWGARYELPIKDLLANDDSDDNNGNGDGVDSSDVIVDGRIAPVTLIHKKELLRQLASPNDPVDPDTGERPPPRLAPEKLNIVISPAPVFGLPLLEDLVQRALVLQSGPEVADYEAWQGNPTGFEVLLDRLKGQDVVLLSGDVHYAYSNQIEFSDAGVNDPASRLIQFCSSSMKNETRMTRGLGRSHHNGSMQDLWELNRERLVAALHELDLDMGRMMKDLSDFPQWFSETAPLLSGQQAGRGGLVGTVGVPLQPGIPCDPLPDAQGQSALQLQSALAQRHDGHGRKHRQLLSGAGARPHMGPTLPAR